jgi:hypothetical protein
MVAVSITNGYVRVAELLNPSADTCTWYVPGGAIAGVKFAESRAERPSGISIRATVARRAVVMCPARTPNRGRLEPPAVSKCCVVSWQLMKTPSASG